MLCLEAAYACAFSMIVASCYVPFPNWALFLSAVVWLGCNACIDKQTRHVHDCTYDTDAGVLMTQLLHMTMHRGNIYGATHA